MLCFSTEDEELDFVSSSDDGEVTESEDQASPPRHKVQRQKPDDNNEVTGSEEEASSPRCKKVKRQKSESLLKAGKKSLPTLVLPEAFDWGVANTEPDASVKSVSSDSEMEEKQVSRTERTPVVVLDHFSLQC